MNKISIFLFFVLIGLDVYSQTNEYQKSVESIYQLGSGYFNIKTKERLLMIAGTLDQQTFVFYGEAEDYTGTLYKYSMETSKMSSLNGYSIIIKDSFNGLNLNVFQAAKFYSLFFLNDPVDNGYQLMYLNHSGRDYILDSIYNADKKIHSSFSSDGRYLLVNTLNTLSDYYNPEQDNRIMVYDLENIDQGEIKKLYIPCNQCSDSYLIGDRLFFTIGRKDGYDNFSNKDIYVAPWGSLKDSVKIASNTDIKAISPDGKYILGTRFWDRQKLTDVIVNVDQKAYQMLLGRDYSKRKAFYSHYENKFVFDFKGYLIYVEYPESFPFDALKWKNEEIPNWTEEEFWEQYEHQALPEK